MAVQCSVLYLCGYYELWHLFFAENTLFQDRILRYVKIVPLVDLDEGTRAFMARVLIIDDDFDILKQIDVYLSYTEHEYWMAHGGAEGVKLALQHLPDIILCDVMMPDYNGYEVLEMLQRSPQTRSTPFVFMSALNERDQVRRGMSVGGDDYLPKPFSMRELEETILARLARRKRLEDTLNTLRENIVYALPHELRTPLMGILWYGDMLQEEAYSIEPEDIRTYAARISSSGTRLLRVVENYLVYAQLEMVVTNATSIYQLRKERTEADLTLQARAHLHAERRNRQADLMLNLAASPVKMSENDLGKLIEELLDNAFKFSEVGTPVTVRGVANCDTNTYTLTVVDKGKGISKVEMQRMGAFMQFNRTLQEQQGLGLGLVIVRRIVEVYGGTFKIASQVEQGTTIEIQIPLALD